MKKIFVSITPLTLELQKGSVQKLAKDPFFEPVYNPPDSLVGDHFLAGYRKATEISKPKQKLHLCTIDRLAYILQTNLKTDFLREIAWAENQTNPILFQRSQKAWQTYPKNYYAIESMSTKVGEILFQKTFDFAWCHLIIDSKTLKRILPAIQNPHDYRFLAEMVLLLKDKIITKDVDWLAWEDPFVFDKNQKDFKKERENDPAEIEKRLSYVIPTIKLLLDQK